MVRLEQIIEKVAAYSPGADLELIKKAYVFSGVVHQGQTRVSGEPYLSHPLEVADILTSLKLDAQSVAAGLLHDTVEDTHTTVEKIEVLFGPVVANLVDGLTKLSRMTFDRRSEREAENFRKMVLAMGRDIRVILIKLADRLHNMRTLAALSPAKQRKISRETIDIYAPMANRLGIGWMKVELEELAFMYLEPERYAWLKDRVAAGSDVQEDHIGRLKKVIEEKLAEQGISGVVTGRSKHLYSIYRKMVDQDTEFENINDIVGFRVVVKEVRDCYAVLGLIHSVWKPVPGRFKDYIALPKLNMYQSLHTTVIGPYGLRMEVQIRTEEMHMVSEYGIAAHWKYKEGKVFDKRDARSFAWLRQLLEWQKDLKDSDEFMESLKVDLFQAEVFVFTPKGEIREFQAGATPVDFAYAIHTDVGNRCCGAKVNGKMAPLDYRLRNGDVVEIITSPTHKPSSEWLDFVVSAKARARIRQWVRIDEREMSISLGRDICDKEFARHGLDFAAMVESGEIEAISRDEYSFDGADTLMASIGYGRIPALQVLSKILPPEKLDPKVSRLRRVLDKFKPGGSKGSRHAVMVRGVEDAMVRFARCCNPLPGDEIAGFITRGKGIAVHARGCPNLLHVAFERRVDVAWDEAAGTAMPVLIEVVCKNEKGLLADITDAIRGADANITSAEVGVRKDNRAVGTFEVEVNDLAHLRKIIKSLHRIKKVLKVKRVRGKVASSAGQENAV